MDSTVLFEWLTHVIEAETSVQKALHTSENGHDAQDHMQKALYQLAALRTKIMELGREGGY